MHKNVFCPACGKADRVEKVSTIYVLGIGLNRLPSDEQAQLKGKITDPTLVSLPSSGLRALGKRLAPPSSGRPGTFRPIHPDMVVITFSLIVPIFLYGILTSQPGMTFPVVVLLATVYGIYFWKRRAIISKFTRQQQTRQAEAERIKQGIARWMKLYYCSRDDGVFEPGSKELVPADQIVTSILRGGTE